MQFASCKSCWKLSVGDKSILFALRLGIYFSKRFLISVGDNIAAL